MRLPGREPTICQVLLSLEVGGAEVLAGRLAHRLSGAYRMVFACLDRAGPLGERLRGEGFAVHILGRRPGLDWRCVRRMAGVLRRERVDLVHAHQYGPFFYAALARLPGPRPPVLLTEHGRFFPDPRRRGRVVANRLLLKGHDRLVAVGRHVRRALVEVEGFPEGRVEVIYNGVDLSRVAEAGRARAEVRAELGVGPGDFVVAQVARLDPLKDHATAIGALEHLRRRRADARLVVVGDGPRAGPLAELVRDRGLGGSARLLGHRTDVPRLLGAADVALLTSVSEGIPLSLIEAMAAGLPVVSTRVGGVPEVVEEGQTGLLAPSGDVPALAEALLRLADDPALRAAMGARARERARALFSEDQMCDAYDRAYREMLAPRPARPAAAGRAAG
jgi:glycosyltransferase involved in cell wall biosynthesis